MCNTRDIIPPQYTGAMGELSLPYDDGKSIIKDMKKGTPLPGSNRSVIDNRATHGYMLLPHNKKWIRGYGYITGTIQLLTSLRIEHSGNIAVLLVLHMFSIQ